MRTRKIIIYALVVVLIAVVGFLVWQKKFAHPAVAAATPTKTTTTTNNSAGNSIGASTANTTSNNTGGTANSTGESGSNNGVTQTPPTAQQVLNQKVVLDVKSTTKYADQSGRNWMELKEVKVGYPSSGGTTLFVDVLFHNGGTNPIDLNLTSQAPAFTIDMPKAVFPSNMPFPSNVSSTISLSAGPNQGQFYHMPFTPDVKVASGQTGEIQFPVWFPVQMPVKAFEDQGTQAIVSYSGTGVGVPLVDSSQIPTSKS